jgi:hypothetical protein
VTDETNPTGPSYVYRAEAVRVIDGDTFVADVDLGFYVHVLVHVRLQGIDTPERGEVGWSDATQRAKDVLFPVDQGAGRHAAALLLRSFHDRRSFERWVCDVWRIEPDGSLRPLVGLLTQSA